MASSLSWGRFAEVGLAAARVNQVKVMMTEHVLAQLGAMPRLDPTRIPGTESFKALGVNSLMGVELRQRGVSCLCLPLWCGLIRRLPSLPRIWPPLLVTLTLEPMSSSTFDAVPAPDQVPRPDEPDVVAPAVCGGSEAGAPRLAENSVE